MWCLEIGVHITGILSPLISFPAQWPGFSVYPLIFLPDTTWWIRDPVVVFKLPYSIHYSFKEKTVIFPFSFGRGSCGCGLLLFFRIFHVLYSYKALKFHAYDENTCIWDMYFFITKVFRWEKTFEIKPNYLPSTARSTSKPCPSISHLHIF